MSEIFTNDFYHCPLTYETLLEVLILHVFNKTVKVGFIKSY